jgi:NADH:ubiquinone oxidoreductase subunit 3 (subunit A)
MNLIVICKVNFHIFLIFEIIAIFMYAQFHSFQYHLCFEIYSIIIFLYKAYTYFFITFKWN